MDTAQIIVLAVGSSAIVFVLWYFFGPRGNSRVSASTMGGVQQVDVHVKGGYSPDVIVVKEGVPVQLNFYRDETSSCSEQIVFSDFGITRNLPAYKTTSVRFTPDKAGEFIFTCGMNMLRGKLIVE